MNKRILDTNFHFHGTSHSFLFESLKSKPAMTWSAKLCTRGPWKHQAKASRKVLNFYQFVIISHTKIEISKTYGLVNPNFPPKVTLFKSVIASPAWTRLDHITDKQVKLDLQSSKLWWNHSDSEVDYSKVIFSPIHSSLVEGVWN